jgi:hypothetical protein
MVERFGREPNLVAVTFGRDGGERREARHAIGWLASQPAVAVSLVGPLPALAQPPSFRTTKSRASAANEPESRPIGTWRSACRNGDGYPRNCVATVGPFRT